MTDVQFDLTAHITPKNQERARTNCRTSPTTFRSMLTSNRVSGVPIPRASQRGRSDVIRPSRTAPTSSTRDVHHRAGRRERRPQRCRPDCQECASGRPGELTPKTAICRQDLVLQSAAPNGDNEFGCARRLYSGRRRRVIVLAAQCDDPEEGGVEFGIHKDNQSPVVGPIRPTTGDVHRRRHRLREVVQPGAELHPLH